MSTQPPFPLTFINSTSSGGPPVNGIRILNGSPRRAFISFGASTVIFGIAVSNRKG